MLRLHLGAAGAVIGRALAALRPTTRCMWCDMLRPGLASAYALATTPPAGTLPAAALGSASLARAD